MSNPDYNDEVTIYELAYLILPSISEDQVGDAVEAIKGIVAKEGGQEIDGEAPFKQDLAYQMSKTVGSSRYILSDAYLGWMKFELRTDKVESLKAQVEKMPEVLRCLLIKAPRETEFTFAKARAALEALEEEKEEAKKAVEPAANSLVEEEVVK